jgi:hypothetical protein
MCAPKTKARHVCGGLDKSKIAEVLRKSPSQHGMAMVMMEVMATSKHQSKIVPENYKINSPGMAVRL